MRQNPTPILASCLILLASLLAARTAAAEPAAHAPLRVTFTAEAGPLRAGVWAGVTFQPLEANSPGSQASPGVPRLIDRLAGMPATAVFTDGPAQTAAPALAFEYSEAYQLRAKIHHIASFATLPLFATEGFLGQSLYNSASSGKRTAHLAVGAAIGTLFGVNTVTGVWNLIEARKDPNKRKLRLTHGLLMLAADGGFFATALLGPNGEGHGRYGFNDSGSRSLHRAVAFTSIGMATTGYLVMLFGNR